MAAENFPQAGPGPAGARSFNEAAANGRGKRLRRRPADPPPGASMRPRRMAAENDQTTAAREIESMLQ